MKMIMVTCLAAALFAFGCGNHHAAQPSTQTAQQSTTPQTPPPVTGEPLTDATPTPPQQTSSAPAPQDSAPTQADTNQPAQASHRMQPVPDMIRIPAGTIFRVRLDQSIDTRRNRAGDRFAASLSRPIVAGGVMVVPRDARFSGHLVECKPSGRLRGHALLGLRLDSFELHGRRYRVRTAEVAVRSGGHKKRNLLLIGGGAGVGTTVGAVAGGPAGALIGAGAGSAAGTLGSAIIGRKQVRLPAETTLAFSLRTPVSVQNLSKRT